MRRPGKGAVPDRPPGANSTARRHGIASKWTGRKVVATTIAVPYRPRGVIRRANVTRPPLRPVNVEFFAVEIVAIERFETGDSP